MTCVMGPGSYIISTPFLSCHFIFLCLHIISFALIFSLSQFGSVPLLLTFLLEFNKLDINLESSPLTAGEGALYKLQMGRHSCCYKQKLRKGLWSPEEDEKLLRHITKYGHGCWSSVPKQAGTPTQPLLKHL